MIKRIRNFFRLFFINDIVTLKDDIRKQQYRIIGFGNITKGPNRQLPPSRIIIVKIRYGRTQWQFRKDCLELYNGN